MISTVLANPAMPTSLVCRPGDISEQLKTQRETAPLKNGWVCSWRPPRMLAMRPTPICTPFPPLRQICASESARFAGERPRTFSWVC